MIQEFLKDKKKIGILIILVIVLIAFGILYVKSGFKELKKNDTESIFVDNSENNDTSNENQIIAIIRKKIIVIQIIKK